jgi:hypothetical protein
MSVQLIFGYIRVHFEYVFVTFQFGQCNIFVTMSVNTQLPIMIGTIFALIINKLLFKDIFKYKMNPIKQIVG